ncbi:23S rRNA (uracil(1939)-C(5))-methyltransferase RlmD [Lentilactobacillus kefiri]|uniref:RNA methyltransferase, TrmA family n=2 Tax=Lentilactobacillus kefiri TaxID=33962 RepID=A0A8E1RHN1_LENKE|nr:23S rRNA (uracil(1939)-C(5))-methyltransferase RlmD [Lentilactobacillus kefiri]KRL58194.1 RNA methyltransferase, TrmA family [Lentilactobacillus parakefiri DSM 10551]KRM50390.1 RNA methyltransferase, TrmA family [Lentilactobacillus kefiri DSM 20587 = JCM 5818]MCJ2162572.1 23S rRNA (uracil(1939)-C(5))-methyltransferase RlmD [Lentilactobacillus kefiri]MCP9369537.1 23S rRNA (uracil(1939)-C(5))-methyltransferase RlmD [Lentilactobacillus kefiri]MDH5109118.1 23S rRNA (uracil(1939)-C(5))-methyltra
MYNDNNEVHVNEGEQLTIDIKRMGINGEGIGYYERKLVFVPGALPTEKVVVEVTDDLNNFIRARLVEILTKSKDRIQPVDDYANNVGGFELENLAYPKQLEFKRDVVRQSLEKYQPNGYRRFKLLPTIGMEDPTHYRNKATFQIRKDADGNTIAGLYKARSHDVVDLKTSALQYPLTMKVMRAIVTMIDELGIPAYDEDMNAGIIKTVVVRAAIATDQVQVTFITQSKKLLKKHQLLERIKAELPEVVSVMQNVNPGKTSLIWGEEMIHLAGRETITEVLNGLKFDLSARAFLQANPEMTSILYEQAFKALDLKGDEKLVDAYSGVGTIGLSVAKQVREVRGMDTIAEAVENANANSVRNGIFNCLYEVGEAEDLLPEWIEGGWTPNALIVDPPRTGLADSLIDTILDIVPKKFVYISCNPSTLAQDLVKLTEKYNVEYIQSVDLMPQTSRCECVVKFKKK